MRVKPLVRPSKRHDQALYHPVAIQALRGLPDSRAQEQEQLTVDNRAAGTDRAAAPAIP